MLVAVIHTKEYCAFWTTWKHISHSLMNLLCHNKHMYSFILKTTAFPFSFEIYHGSPLKWFHQGRNMTKWNLQEARAHYGNGVDWVNSVALSWGERGNYGFNHPWGDQPRGHPEGAEGPEGVAPRLIPEGWFKTYSRVWLQTMTLSTNSRPAVLQGDDYIHDHP